LNTGRTRPASCRSKIIRSSTTAWTSSTSHITSPSGSKHAPTIERILAHIREQGPVRSSDFERSDGQKGSWWNWKEEKQVLEYLHTPGY
jgi:uncharacterized protein